MVTIIGILSAILLPGYQSAVNKSRRSDGREALAEMMNADGLLLFQASNCNHQIPAKIYEYLRARRPILALTDPRGDTATTLHRAGTGTVVPLDSTREIARVLPGFLAAIADRTVRPAADAAIAGLSRRHRTAELAGLQQRLREHHQPLATG